MTEDESTKRSLNPMEPADTACHGVADPPLPFTGGRIPSSEKERKFAERTVMIQYFIAPALAFAAILAGFNFEWQRLMAAGVIILGFCGLWIGYFAVKERRLIFIRGGSMTRRSHRYFIYEGLAAVAYGLAYTAGGACLVTLAVLFLSGMSLAQMRDVALARPGLVLFPLGVLTLCYGLGFVIGFTHRSGSWWQRVWAMLIDAPARLSGLILIVLAMAALVIGGIEWFAPALFNQWFESIFGNPWPFKVS